ncbi:MAG: galactokinase [Pirellulales bacterium]|nr:galactokinase [Pirellulales bacterium]
MPLDAQRVAQEFTRRFDGPPRWIVRAPGRVNLIGEHTDYNDGFVLPLAIDRAVWIALRPRDDRQVVVHSIDFDDHAFFDLDTLTKGQVQWLEYVKGTAWSLREAGFRLDGWEGVLLGDVPAAAGLSSSAALEMATARAFAAVGSMDWDPIAMARLAQRAENGWVGMQCGIMDQLASAAGQAGHAVLIDCRSLAVTPVPLPPGTAVAVLDTGTRRGLVDSAYNERRAQCEAAAAFFKVPSLRDVELDHFHRLASGLDETTRRRATHVITENDRVLRTVEALGRGDLDTVGPLLGASHVSLRDDFEVSSDALDAIVTSAQAHPACHGARMTGAGFGGCAVALIDAARADHFARDVTAQYAAQTPHEATIYVCQATDGTDVVVA